MIENRYIDNKIDANFISNIFFQQTLTSTVSYQVYGKPKMVLMVLMSTLIMKVVYYHNYRN